MPGLSQTQNHVHKIFVCPWAVCMYVMYVQRWLDCKTLCMTALQRLPASSGSQPPGYVGLSTLYSVERDALWSCFIIIITSTRRRPLRKSEAHVSGMADLVGTANAQHCRVDTRSPAGPSSTVSWPLKATHSRNCAVLATIKTAQ
jgi:hypothetical protein